MAEKTFSKRIGKTSVEEARKKLSNARSDKMKKYWKGILEIRLDEYNNLSKGGVPMKGKTKMAKKMRGGGSVMAKKMRGGGMAKMASKKKMMRGGMAKKKK
tara:strand:+ start:8 stop:310 length:303 start_codon:yes stop_codon:yes gene_type:complete